MILEFRNSLYSSIKILFVVYIYTIKCYVYFCNYLNIGYKSNIYKYCKCTADVIQIKCMYSTTLLLIINNVNSICLRYKEWTKEDKM